MKKTITLSVVIGIVLGAGLCFGLVKTDLLSFKKTENLPYPENEYSTQLHWGKQIVYTNTEYGFKFMLPESWTGYTVSKTTWESRDEHNKLVASGPILTFNNPKSTTQKPYQNIPIMVFTLEQWSGLGVKYPYPWAGGIPAELGRNSKYIFILTPRYNFFEVEGIQDVEKIIESGPLQAF